MRDFIDPVGSVLLVDKWVYTNGLNYLDAPAWCVVTAVKSDHYIVDWLIGGPKNTPHSCRDDIVYGDDIWRVVISSKWPDEVCVALAKRALLIEGEST